MAIDPVTNRTQSSTTAKASLKSETNASKAQTTGKAPVKDSIKITDNAARISKALQTASDLPEVDEERVANIKQALADGTYEVNGEKIADKMTGFDSLFQSNSS